MKPQPASTRPFWTLRRYFLPLVAGALINGAIYLALTYRLATKQERLTREYASLNDSVIGVKDELQELESESKRIAENNETAGRFFSEVVLPRDPGLTEAIAELDRLAEESRVEHDSTIFLYEPLDVGLVRASARMPLAGSYFDLVRFINRIERSPRFFLVNEIGLRRSAREGNEVELTCDISFFFRENAPAEENQP